MDTKLGTIQEKYIVKINWLCGIYNKEYCRISLFPISIRKTYTHIHTHIVSESQLLNIYKYTAVLFTSTRM